MHQLGQPEIVNWTRLGAHLKSRGLSTNGICKSEKGEKQSHLSTGNWNNKYKLIHITFVYTFSAFTTFSILFLLASFTMSFDLRVLVSVFELYVFVSTFTPLTQAHFFLPHSFPTWKRNWIKFTMILFQMDSVKPPLLLSSVAELSFPLSEIISWTRRCLES